MRSTAPPRGDAELVEFLARMPLLADVPADEQSILVENRDGVGPYGAKGTGEGPTSSMCAAVSNAIYRAVGVRLRAAPFTPERVWLALQGTGPHPGGEGAKAPSPPG